MRPLVGNGFQFRRTDGNWVLVWLFFRPRVRGSQGTSPFEFRQYRQTRFGYARSKRSQPQFKAHNSVRPFENGLRSLGSSATRPKHRCSPDSRVATRRTEEPQDRPGTQALLGGHEPGRRSILRDAARPASPIRKSRNHREPSVKNPKILPRTRLSTKVSIETTRRVLLCHSSPPL